MSSRQMRQVNRIMYLGVKVTGIRQQSDEVQQLLRIVESARRALATYRLLQAAAAGPTPLGVALAAVASISFAMDLGGAL